MDYEVEETQDPEAQKILDGIANGDNYEEADDDIKLPSDELGYEVSDDEEDGKLYAGKYKSIDELKNGIKNLKSTLPEYVIDGMSDEALEKHYSELNSQFSKGRKHIISDSQEDNPSTSDEKPSAAKNIPQDVWTELKESVDTKGGLTDSQYEKLEKYGIPSEIVDEYLDGLVAKQAALAGEIHNLVGGFEKFTEIKEWADRTLDNEYLLSIQNMTRVQMKNAVLGIKAQYELANNKMTRLVGSSSSTGNRSSYLRQEDYLRDVSDKRYAYDDAFRRKVDSKLKASTFK